MTDPLRRPQTGAWSTLLAASNDRDEALRAQRPVVPSTSVTPRRCQACQQWARADVGGGCTACGCPYVAVAIVGMARGA